MAIVVAAFIGFLAGQFLGLLLEGVGAAIAHYPGGLNALDRAANPPWWSNALAFLGIWTGFAAAIIYAYREGHLRALPDQWRPRVGDAIYIVVGVAMQFIIDLAYEPFHFKSLSHPVNHLFKAAHGPGFVLIAILTTFVAPIFEEYAELNGVSSRVKFQPGSFFSDPLPRVDVITMGHILHDWNLEEKRMLIRKAYEALPEGGAFIAYDAIIDDDRSKNAFGLLMSLNMLIETPGGFDYTGADCMGWMKEAGFRETRVEHLVGPDSMVVGIK